MAKAIATPSAPSGWGGPRLYAMVGSCRDKGCRHGWPGSAVGALLGPLSHHACPSEAPAPSQPALFPSLRLCPGVFGWGVACPPSSPAQGGSSKAWHRLRFLQNIHNNNINNNRLDDVGLGHCPGVLVGRQLPMKGRAACWPPPGHCAAGPGAVGAGRPARPSAAPGS